MHDACNYVYVCNAHTSLVCLLMEWVCDPILIRLTIHHPNICRVGLISSLMDVIRSGKVECFR